MITGVWAVTVVSLKALSKSLGFSQGWMLDLPQISVNNATFKLFGALLTDAAEYNDHKWVFWKRNVLLALAPCFWTWIRHLIPFLQNGFCRDDPCAVSLVSGKKGRKKKLCWSTCLDSKPIDWLTSLSNEGLTGWESESRCKRLRRHRAIKRTHSPALL